MTTKSASAVDQHQFLEHRRQQEEELWAAGVVYGILSAEINTTELCNRTCVFCPRHNPKVYPNRNFNMTIETAANIAGKLQEAGYNGKISFSGFGENLLNENFPGIIRAFSSFSLLECNTNGDQLTSNQVDLLFESGLDLLYINLYDGEHQIEHFESIMCNIDRSMYKYRMHWDQESYGLVLNNRSGLIDWIGFDRSSPGSLHGKPCYYPFYKLFVDWNGDVLFCSNDWGKERIIGNLVSSSLKEVWFSAEMLEVRRKLAAGDRNHSPCKNCSVDGTLFGKKSFDYHCSSLSD